MADLERPSARNVFTRSLQDLVQQVGAHTARGRCLIEVDSARAAVSRVGTKLANIPTMCWFQMALSVLVGVMGIVPPLLGDTPLDAAGIVTISAGSVSCFLAALQGYWSTTPVTGA